jgi:hypothetical protein
MISFKLNGVPTLFIKGFTSGDIETMLNFAREANAHNLTTNSTILFIDTPITAPTVEAVHKLKDEGFRVVFRDHHGIDGEPTNDRDRQVSMASAKLQQLLGYDCTITVRRKHPACSTLVTVGEFSDALAVIADPDPDGLTAAMKAVGIYYPELDQDAALLDGEPSMQVTGSPLSALLAKGVATLPPYDVSRPREREKALEQLFMRWVAAAQGDARAATELEAGVEAYDQAVNVAHELAPTAKEVAPGVMLVDTIESELYDPGTLMALLEKRTGCKVTVFRKDKGPIAALHGIQYSLAVTKAFQSQVNLQNVLPSHTKSDPKLGVISNVSFLLHVSDLVWHEQVLPALQTI